MSKFRDLFETVLEDFYTNKHILVEATPVDYLTGTIKAKIKTKWKNFEIEDQEKKGRSHQNGETNSKYFYVTTIQTYELPQFKLNYIVPSFTFPVTIKVRCSNHDKFNNAKDVNVSIPNPKVFKPTREMKDGLMCYELNKDTIEDYTRQGLNDIFTALNTRYKEIINKLNKITGKMLMDIWQKNDNYLLTNYDILFDFLDTDQEFKSYFLKWMNTLKTKGIQKKQISLDYSR